MTNETQNEQAAAAVDITMLPPAERALIILNSTKTEQDLTAMVAEAKAITEVADKAGRDTAHTVAMKLRKARTTIEKVGKAAREDATAFSKAVIDEEKRLKAITASEEERVLALRDAYDAKLEAEKEAARRAEEQRLAAISEKIEGIRRLPMGLVGEPAEVILAERGALAAFEPTADVFGEFVDDALATLADAIRALDDMLARLQAQAEAEARLAEERERAAREMAEKQAEADRLKAEAERAQAERDAMAAELAAARAQLAAAQSPKEESVVEDEPPAFEDAGSESEPSGDRADQWTEQETLEMRLSGAAPLDFNRTDLAYDVASDRVVVLDHAPAADEHVDIVAETLAQTAASITPMPVRMAALATAGQFDALADKVEACGFGQFSNDLRAIAYGLREGDHDGKIAEADFATLIAADERLIEESAECIQALTGERVADAA